MLSQLRPAIVMLVLFVALTGLAYPLAITGVAQVTMQRQANGSLVEKSGAVVGSALIGQSFTSDRYFHARPSATSAPDPADDTKTVDAPYKSANSGGSNLGPIARKLIDRVKGDIEGLRGQGVTGSIPADAVTASGSGLDPDISPATALFQVPRVASVRGMAEERVR